MLSRSAASCTKCGRTFATIPPEVESPGISGSALRALGIVLSIGGMLAFIYSPGAGVLIVLVGLLLFGFGRMFGE